MEKKKIAILFSVIFIFYMCSLNVFGLISSNDNRMQNLSNLKESATYNKSVVELNNLDNEISSYKCTDIENQIKAYQKQIDTLNQSAASSTANQSNYTNLQNQIAALQAQLSGLDSSLPEYAVKLSQITTLQAQLSGITLTTVDTSQIEAQIKEYQKQIIILQNQLDNLKNQQNLTQQKTDQEIQIAKHKLQIEYYNACLYSSQKDVENENLLYLTKQLQVEKEKLDLGETTENAVALIENNVKLSNNKIDSFSNSIDASKQAMLVILEEYSLSPSSLSTDFDLANASVRTLDSEVSSIQNDFITKNLDIQQQNYTIENQKKMIISLGNTLGTDDITYKSAVAQLNKSEIQLETTIESYKSYIFKKYYDYSSAKNNYTTILEQQKILAKSMEILKQNYDIGQISELQFLSEKTKIASERYSIITAFVQADNLADEVELLANGVVIE